jgi:hypothetical protein
MKQNKVKLRLFILLILSLLIPLKVLSKNRAIIKTPDLNTMSRIQPRLLEERFRPFIENRISNRMNPQHRHKPDKYSKYPDDIEFMLLARYWSSLSDDFKREYKSSLIFPDNFTSFSSPGGHFEIYYTTRGIDSVSTEDQYGYITDASWIRTSQPNGIPDYIDETALALDSAWHMEIDRFGFPPPYPYKDSLRYSDKYKVLVQLPEESGVYGVTLFDQRMDTNSFSSFITIRNEWSGFDTEPLKYDIDPTPAIHVTCAHEFFHAIQYGMTWDMKSIGGTKDPTSLDDFPLTWTEGCGAFMEELAFPEVDDYIQYALPYFFDPETASFFSQDHINSNPYFTTLFLLFQKTRLSATDDIDFLKQMYFNNYMKYLPFKENLSNVVNKSHFTWPEVLNRFHTASFFTGTRADTSIFIADAPKFIDWNVKKVAPSIQNIRENSLGLYSIKKQNIHYDSLFINLQPEMSDTEQAEPDSWAASALLRHGKSTVITPFELDKYGKGSLIIPNWKAQDECIVAVSSGFSDSDRKFSVDFTPCQVTHDSGSIDTVYYTTNRNSNIFASIIALSNLRCELSFSKIPITSRMASEALMNNMPFYN